MGLTVIVLFAACTWTVMMAAMARSHFPSFPGLRGRRRADALLVPRSGTSGSPHFAIWLAFGVVCYLAYNALGMPWRSQALAGGAALGLAGLYALTPLKRTSQERCREVFVLHCPCLSPPRAGAVPGRYGLSCLGCSAGLMVAMVLVGMTSLGWTIVLAAFVLVYKFAPPAAWRLDVTLAALAPYSGSSTPR